VSYIKSLSVVMNWDKQGLNTLTEDQQTTAERFNKPKHDSCRYLEIQICVYRGPQIFQILAVATKL
jgi:hypothetical protein